MLTTSKSCLLNIPIKPLKSLNFYHLCQKSITEQHIQHIDLDITSSLYTIIYPHVNGPQKDQT